MLIDRFVRLLLPRQGQFFTLLEGIADQIQTAAGVFEELGRAEGHPAFEAIAVKLKSIEVASDAFEAGVHEELDRTFVTPIDREDLAALAKVLDDVVDGMEHAATFASLYQFERLTDPMKEQVRLSIAAAGEVAGAAHHLRRFGDPEAVRNATAAVRKLESEADSVYRKAVASLFTESLTPADLVRQKDLLFALEGVSDQCEDAMDVIRSVLVKNG